MGQQQIDISKQITPIVQKTQNEMRDTQITCFTCGLPGHKANICPSSSIQTKKDDFKNVRRVWTTTADFANVIMVKVGARTARCILDSGAEVSVVKQDLVREDQLTGGYLG